MRELIHNNYLFAASAMMAFERVMSMRMCR